MAAKKTLYDELNVVSASAAGESLKDYTLRVAAVISAMDDPTYAKLSKSVQAWFDAVVDATQNNKDIPAMAGFPVPAAAAAAPATTTKPARKPAKAAAAPAPATQPVAPAAAATAPAATVAPAANAAPAAKPAKPAKAAKAPAERKARTPSVWDKTLEHLIKNPTMDFPALASKVGKDAVIGSYVFNCWWNVSHVLKAALAAGYSQK